MPDRNLIRTLNRLQEQLEGKEIAVTPIIISDSKGNYLKRQVRNTLPHITDKFVWWCVGGATIERQIRWVRQNLQRELSRLGPVVVYVWLGTCDLTSKRDNGQIFLQEQDNTRVDYIEQKYKELIEYLQTQGVQVIALEIPLYSIKYWNACKTGTVQEEQSEQDKVLERQIEELNKRIRILNENNEVQAPNFNIDLQWNRKKKGHSKLYTDWKLLKDGVHPTNILAQIWLLKIATYCRRIKDL